MYKVRNRHEKLARNAVRPPSAPSPRDDIAFMLRQSAAPPASFPADTVLPPHRGAVITAASWPATAVPAPASASANPPPAHSPPAMSRKAAKKAARRAAALARTEALAAPVASPVVALPATQPPAIPALPSVEQLIIEPPAEAAESPPSPQDEAACPAVQTEIECAPALALPSEPDACAEPSAPVEVATSPEVALPTARALVPRRQGFIDILAFVLRDSGRRLSRWSSARRRADDMKAKLAKAEARMRAMEAQLAALQALQERVRQSA